MAGLAGDRLRRGTATFQQGPAQTGTRAQDRQATLRDFTCPSLQGDDLGRRQPGQRVGVGLEIIQYGQGAETEARSQRAAGKRPVAIGHAHLVAAYQGGHGKTGGFRCRFVDILQPVLEHRFEIREVPVKEGLLVSKLVARGIVDRQTRVCATEVGSDPPCRGGQRAHATARIFMMSVEPGCPMTEPRVSNTASPFASCWRSSRN